MTKPKYIYIAGPYTKPDPAQNTNRAIQIADDLLAAGYVPFVPHLCHLWELISPKPYTAWTEYDLEWLERCDAVLRFDGDSAGADAEVKRAEELGIPVFYGLGELYAKY